MQLTVRSLSRKASAGLAMLEALAALLILTAGAVGVLWWQQQATLRQQQQTYQFIAMALASDLADRMRINASQSALYAMHWGESRQTTQDCFANACSWTQLAQWDIAQWQQALRAQLPKGDASVYSLRGQTGWWAISVGWPANKISSNSTTCPAHMQCWNLWVRPQR
ncbi:MAG: type IV pilus modification protein PilV [Betaproteobacteria bacterium]|jgi:type IV pilus assembly protein PilV|nr:type IV pilus modification protein PilV [Betaproteobacteria bacterium]